MLVIEINIKIEHQITNFFMSKIITKARKQIYINIYLKLEKNQKKFFKKIQKKY